MDTNYFGLSSLNSSQHENQNKLFVCCMKTKINCSFVPSGEKMCKMCKILLVKVYFLASLTCASCEMSSHKVREGTAPILAWQIRLKDGHKFPQRFYCNPNIEHNHPLGYWNISPNWSKTISHTTNHFEALAKNHESSWGHKCIDTRRNQKLSFTNAKHKWQTRYTPTPISQQHRWGPKHAHQIKLQSMRSKPKL
jgi:hypothetical protein